MNKDKLISIANIILLKLRNAEIDHIDEGWEWEVAHTPDQLKYIFDNSKEANGDKFLKYLQMIDAVTALNCNLERLEGFANGTLYPTLLELSLFAELKESNPDYILFVPLNEGDITVGVALINIGPWPELEYSLIDVFEDEASAEKHVIDNWYLGD